MKIIRSREFTASRPWGALDIANMRGITTRLHWTNEPYRWHVYGGEEVFAVLDTGDVLHASVGTEHVAHRLGEARLLVIETEGSV